MKTRRRFLMTGIVVGTLLALGPIWGLIGTAYGMASSFKHLGDAGISDPRALSQSVGFTLWATTAGLVVCPIGIALMVTSLIYYARACRAISPPFLAALPPPGD